MSSFLSNFILLFLPNSAPLDESKNIYKLIGKPTLRVRLAFITVKHKMSSHCERRQLALGLLLGYVVGALGDDEEEMSPPSWNHLPAPRRRSRTEYEFSPPSYSATGTPVTVDATPLDDDEAPPTKKRESRDGIYVSWDEKINQFNEKEFKARYRIDRKSVV